MADEDPEDVPAGEEPAGEEPAGEETAGEETAGEETAGEETAGEETATEEEDPLKDVENLVEQATVELDSVADASAELETSIKNLQSVMQETTLPTKPAGGDLGGKGSVFQHNPAIDAAVMAELEDAEKQAKECAKVINVLKERVGELMQTPKMTESENKELEEKNRQLVEQMKLLEEKTRRIQFLLGQANLFEDMPTKPMQVKRAEDMLPKVIICGVTENNMPKIIVCDDKKKRRSKDGSGPGSDGRRDSRPCSPDSIGVSVAAASLGANAPGSFGARGAGYAGDARGMDAGGGRTCPGACIKKGGPMQDGMVPKIAKRLSESYNMQEKLAAENANLEGKRYQLQEDLLNKDQTVDSLQRRLNSLQNEMRVVCNENCVLSAKLQNFEIGKPGTGDNQVEGVQPQKTMPCGKGKGPCPADVESRLLEYSETTHQLEKQLTDMETEVRCMQTELVSVQKERQHLEHHRRLLCQPPTCPPPCAPKPVCPAPCSKGSSSDQQLRELREQYNRLQDDYKGKLTEVAGLRADSEKLKQNAKDAEDAKKALEDKVKDQEKELKNYRLEKKGLMGSKEQLIEQEQQLNVAKQRFREAQDELEELRALIQDQQSQLDDYRNKYLQAQQQVEEQRRQIDMMEMENNRVSEQVNLEIQRVKNQFQEKLQELTPLPDILKATQIKLQEAQQMHLLAERNNEALVRELQVFRDKANAMANQMEQVRSDQQLGADERMNLQQHATDLENKLKEMEEEYDTMKADYVKLEEIAEENEKRVQEKLHEIAQLVAQLETVREESARQVARTKDRCETVRRSMQNQIADLERQLAQSRAQARQAQKDRDEIRQKMQSQINNLNENFEDAQMRIRNLQGHVNFLKSSYTNVFPPSEPNIGMLPEGMDGCDCGNAY